MPDINIRNLAESIAGHHILSTPDKIKFLNYIADLSYPLSDRTKQELEILQLSLIHYIMTPSWITLQLLSCHFCIAVSKTKSTLHEVVFDVTPYEDETLFYNSNVMAIIKKAAKSLAEMRKIITIHMVTGFGDAEVMWYRPFDKLISIKYLHEAGGYTVRDWEGIQKLYHMARIIGF
jgi:hypothetical protein